MTTQEFSNSFDVQLNSFGLPDNSNIKLNEYEKSVFLTKAQKEIVVSFYNGKNVLLNSFEKTEELRRYLSSLVKTKVISPVLANSDEVITNKSKIVNLPEDLWFITFETAKIQSDDECLNGKELEVTPVTQDTFHRTKNNPFRKDNSRRVLRLDIGDNKVELVSDYNISEYKVRYIKALSPIILTVLEGVDIEGKTDITECTLHPALHQVILDKAVELAVQSYGLTLKNQ